VKLFVRPYKAEGDYWRIRDFLRQVFLLNHRRMICWPLIRLDYWRWHGIMNLGDGSLESGVFLWETSASEIVAVLNQEGAGQVFLQVHPNYKTSDLEEQMIAQAEEHLRAPSRRGGMVLWIWSDSADDLRKGLLEKRGYTHIASDDEYQWYCDLEQTIPDTPQREGYTIRSLGEAAELPSRCWASWRAFHPNEPDEKYDRDYTWYRNIQSVPLYRRDLDLVAIAPSGEVAAFTTLWYDDVTRSGCFEPVGTVPEHQRHGLGRSLMIEGLHRLKRMGGTLAMTSGYSLPANALYKSVLGPVHTISQPWEKRWPG